METAAPQQTPAESALVTQFLQGLRELGGWTILEPQPGRNERQAQWENKEGEHRVNLWVYEHEGKLHAYAGGEKFWTGHTESGQEWNEWQDYEIDAEYVQQESQPPADFAAYCSDEFISAPEPSEPYIEEPDFDDMGDSQVNELVANLLEEETPFEREEKEALANATPEQMADRKARKQKMTDMWRRHQNRKFGRPNKTPAAR